MTSVHELKKRMSSVLNTADGLSDVITANGEDMGHGFIYLVTSTAKRAMFGQRLICMKSKDTQWHNQKVDVWCATS
jgi:hypothetical protein